MELSSIEMEEASGGTDLEHAEFEILFRYPSRNVESKLVNM